MERDCNVKHKRITAKSSVRSQQPNKVRLLKLWFSHKNFLFLRVTWADGCNYFKKYIGICLEMGAKKTLIC